MEIYANQQINSNSVKFSAYNTRRDTFTFLKSNYKYKRRNLETHQCHTMASQCRGNAINKIIATSNDNVTAAECHSINKVIKDTWTSCRRQKNTYKIYATLLRMLLLIISNTTKKLPYDGKQHITKGNAIAINGKKVIDKQLENCTKNFYTEGKVASDSTFYAVTSLVISNDDVNSDDSDKMNFQRNDVKVSISKSTIIGKKTKATTPTVSSSRSSMSSTPSTSSTSSSSITSIASYVLPMTTLSTATKSTLSSLLPLATDYSSTTRIGDKIFTFLVALFIAFALCARSVTAGACWQTALDNGKCNEIFSLNITKAECCRHSQEFSYTERDLSEVEYFFATAIGGGMECTPCIESCKNIECGANKKCVKRKGRPKCICAPECGSAARHHRQHQQKQQHYRGHLHHSEQLPRDIRSLSSEITNFNLELNTRDDVGSNNNGAINSNRHNHNQRKMLILQSHRNHRHHQHQHQHHDHNNNNKNQQQKQHNHERPLQVQAGGKRLVIIANVDPKESKQQTTTRRLQIISNVVKGENVKTKTPSTNSSSSSTITSNAWSTTSMNDDKVKRRLMSRHKTRENDQLFPEKVQMRRKNHKKNSNNCSDDLNINQNHNNVSKSNNNCNTNNRLRHNRQRTSDNTASKPNHKKLMFNINEDDSTADFNDNDDDDDDDDGGGGGNVGKDNSQQRSTHHHQKLQRKRKQKDQHCLLHHHQFHRQHYHSHRNRAKQQQKQKLQLESQQEKQKLKDQRLEEAAQRLQEHNNKTMTMQMLPANGATFLMPTLSGPSLTSAAEASSSSSSSLPTTTTTQFIQNVKSETSLATQTDTFANSATSLLSASGRVVITDRQHLLNHGSVFATSSTQTTLEKNTTTALSSSSTSSAKLKATISVKSDKVPDLSTEGVVNNTPLTSSLKDPDDFALLDGIYENFDLYGFPNQQNKNMDFEIIQHNSHPVCGTDGRTYHTECQLKKRACRTNNQHLQVAYRGHCKTSCNGVKCLNGLTCVEDNYMIPHCIACKIDCPEDEDILKSQKSLNHRIIIDPSRAVCGVDGKTYKSICDINRMICKIGRSIGVAYPGPCRTDRITCSDINCGPKHKCLVDLLTHEPRCVSCRYKCARKRHPTSLRYEEGKICGVNNHTYNSWCEMRKDSCTTGFFIDVKSVGQCM